LAESQLVLDLGIVGVVVVVVLAVFDGDALFLLEAVESRVSTLVVNVDVERPV
jgi:hypothetical protein